MEPLSSPFQTFGHQPDFPDLMDTLHYDDMVPEFAWDESSSVEGLESISREESLVFNLDQATDLPVMTLDSEQLQDHRQPYGDIDPLLMADFYQQDTNQLAEMLETTTPKQKPQQSSKTFQCWDHGCNGRHFSSKSNLIRHQKEKSKTTSNFTCPLCAAVFTRSSARDTHLARQSCNRIRRYSNGRPRPSRLAVLSNPELVRIIT
ncbi:hypothetical protein ASPACDRAFT_43188 [Aspergillus aculeatus ATCC 16872]|uniref:C2H2-type domain-containing protein n=1 Tax=Aspergillus aculeatus (strain ATCC 16872 / CBS 172.66 / WB 5094) TaxID=690307 RepID=A0A1L9WTV5_ASPA1|nr:uncharacterized protein ASPACDRAFT_43188 [Aspergillus aculeatus ATCC 16872]OJJ99568.1 hypothetical protein ASPACDRAFT_43188 [Aspergillus aculeatus ATCC 16872]